MKVHFQDPTLLTAPRLIPPGGINLIFGTQHTVVLDLVAGEQEDPVPITPMGIVKWDLVIVPGFGDREELWSAVYTSSVVSGNRISLPVQILSSKAYAYVEGKAKANALFTLKGYTRQDDKSSLKLNLQLPMTLQANAAATPTYDVVEAKQAAADASAAKVQAVAAKTAAEAASLAASVAEESAVCAGELAVAAKDAAVAAKASAEAAKDAAVVAKDSAAASSASAAAEKDLAVVARNAAAEYSAQAASASAYAVAAKEDTINAKAQALQAKDDAVAAKGLAVDAKDQAVAAKDAAVSAKDDALIAKAGAVSAKDEAVSAKSDAVSAKDEAVTAKTQAVQAKDDAVTAKEQAEAVKAGCQVLKDQSQAIYNSIVAINTFMVGHAYNYGLTVTGTQVSICWTDPSDLISQEMATIAFWQKTRLLYKVGGFPADENDGIVLVDSAVRDQYRETPFTYDMGATSNYYFALFTCTTGGVWNTKDSAPRFTTGVLTWATIQMMTRTNTLLLYPGMAVGSVVDIQVNSLYPKMRYKLAHVNYMAHHQQVSDFHYDHTKVYNSIWIPNYLPCLGDSNDAYQIQFDAQELAYAQTWDEVFITGKAYYKLVDGTYVQLTVGTDYNDGENIAAWSAREGIAVYTKNHADRVSKGCNSWKDSNLRQWLNATGIGWFSKQNEYDVLGNQGASGWMTGFDQRFLNLIMPVYNKTARNTISTISGGGGGGFDITLDKFWLPSTKEFQNSNTNNIAEGTYWDYFSQVATTAESRIQRDEGGTARGVWLRSPYTGNSYNVYYITASGSSTNNFANYSYAFLPAMCIA